MPLTLVYQTPTEFAERFWNRVRTAQNNGDVLEFSRLIVWLFDRIQLGDISNDQARISFNRIFNRSLTLTQWNSFVTTRLVPIKDRYIAMKTEVTL